MDGTEEFPAGAVEVPGDNPPAGGEESGKPSEVEVLAREKGWRSKEEFEGDEESWVGAEEFIKRQPLFDKIKTQSKKLKELERTVEALAKHYNESVTQAKERMISELKAERKEAIELGEADRVDAIDNRIQEVARTVEPPKPAPVIDTEIEAFVEANSDWFNRDKEMTRFAVAYNEGYLKDHPGDIGKSLDETLKAVKKAFPEKFVNKRKTDPAPVEGGQPSGKGGDKYNYSRLTPEQKLVYNQLVKTHKQISHDEYFRSLEEAGYLQ